MSLIKITITESSQQLLELSAQQTNRWNYYKIKALYLLKTGEVSTLEDAATILGVSLEAIKKWISKYRQVGLDGLLVISKSHQSIVPSWAIERLQQELETTQFLPSSGATRAWLLTIGIKVCKSKASEVHSWMEVYRSSDMAAPSPQLLIEPEIHARYEQWKQENQLSSDVAALNALLFEFFGLPSHSFDDLLDDIEASDSLQTPEAGNKVSVLLRQTDLAKRLGVTDTILKNNRNKQNFPRWTKLKDPTSVAWKWIPSLRKYKSLPQEVL